MPCAVSKLWEAPCAKDGGKANNASPDKKIFFWFIVVKLLLTNTGNAWISVKFSKFVNELLAIVFFREFLKYSDCNNCWLFNSNSVNFFCKIATKLYSLFWLTG